MAWKRGRFVASLVLSLLFTIGVPICVVSVLVMGIPVCVFTVLVLGNSPGFLIENAMQDIKSLFLSFVAPLVVGTAIPFACGMPYKGLGLSTGLRVLGAAFPIVIFIVLFQKIGFTGIGLFGMSVVCGLVVGMVLLIVFGLSWLRMFPEREECQHCKGKSFLQTVDIRLKRILDSCLLFPLCICRGTKWGLFTIETRCRVCGTICDISGRHSLIPLLVVFVLANVLVIMPWLSSVDREEIAILKQHVNEVKGLVTNHRKTQVVEKPAIEGGVIVWDMLRDSRSGASGMLPRSLWANADDKQVTVFLVLPERRKTYIGTYSISKQPAYRVDVDVAVAYWPEAKLAGVFQVAGDPPRSTRTPTDAPEYGDMAAPIGRWIKTLPKESTQRGVSPNCPMRSSK